MDMLLDIVLDAGKDTLALVPFLFVTYVALELLEHMAGERVNALVRRAGAAGPVVGAALGVVPQCGFSAMGATLYAGRVVTLGTLVAVFLSTSDEMLPMLVAEQVSPATMASILVPKLLIALVTGVAIDVAVRAVRHNARLHAALRRGVLGPTASDEGVDVLDAVASAGEGVEHICRLCEQDRCACGHDHAHAQVGADEGASGCVGQACGEDASDVRDGHASHGVVSHDCADGHAGDCAGWRAGDCTEGHAGDRASGFARTHDCNHGCGHGHEHGHGHVHDHGIDRDREHVYHREHGHGCGQRGRACGLAVPVLRSALSHTVQVSVFIFLVTLVLVTVLETVGEEALASFIAGNEVLAVFASALVGLVPNCAASVVITQLYLEGVLGYGPLMAGLLVSAGVGYLVLFRTNRRARENVLIVLALYVVAVLWGLVLGVLPLSLPL